jgi:hypothetical protein
MVHGTGARPGHMEALTLGRCFFLGMCLPGHIINRLKRFQQTGRPLRHGPLTGSQTLNRGSLLCRLALYKTLYMGLIYEWEKATQLCGHGMAWGCGTRLQAGPL